MTSLDPLYVCHDVQGNTGHVYKHTYEYIKQTVGWGTCYSSIIMVRVYFLADFRKTRRKTEMLLLNLRTIHSYTAMDY